LERNIIVERIKGGIRRAKEKGKTLGRPKTLNLDTKELISLRRRGLSLRRIATRVNASLGTVHKILSKRSPRSIGNKQCANPKLSVH
jgi:putative DNA-invertase from lambdoid prophage Rac